MDGPFKRLFSDTGSRNVKGAASARDAGILSRAMQKNMHEHICTTTIKHMHVDLCGRTDKYGNHGKGQRQERCHRPMGL